MTFATSLLVMAAPGPARLPGGASARRSFTLIELLIVMAIIAILAGIAVVGINAAIEASEVNRTQTMITQLVDAIEAYETDNQRYPPALIDDLWDDLQHPDGTNTGIETLLLVLRAPRKGGGDPYFPISKYEDNLKNLDDDELPEAFQRLGIQSSSAQLLELVDAWGSPLVYIPASRYQDEFEYSLIDGTLTTVRAEAGSVSGQMPIGYMIWSFGPDGINNNGKGDDVVSWSKSDADERAGDEENNQDELDTGEEDTGD